MGRQIAIATTAADEETFLSFLRQGADIQLLTLCAFAGPDLGRRVCTIRPACHAILHLEQGLFMEAHIRQGES